MHNRNDINRMLSFCYSAVFIVFDLLLLFSCAVMIEKRYYH